MEKSDLRYPNTYACDYVRSFGGHGEHGVKMSRSDASSVINAVAKALGMNDEILRERLADYYMANEKEITDKSVAEFMRATGLTAA